MSGGPIKRQPPPEAAKEAPKLKRNFTTEEVDALKHTAESLSHSTAEGPKGGLGGAPTLPSISADTVGLHLTKDRCHGIYLSKRGTVEKEFSIGTGYGEVDTFVKELSHELSKFGKKRLNVNITTTGAVSPSIIADLPKLNRNMLIKALKVQFKNQTGQDKDDIHFFPLPDARKKAESNTTFVAMAVEKQMLEKLPRALRRLKIKLTAWDSDLLSFIRAADMLWKAHNLDNSTRLLIQFDWEECHLIISSPDGKLVMTKLPVGVEAFLQHVIGIRENMPQEFLSENALRGRQHITDQAVHDVYVPLAQKIKTQLYAACNEHGIALPTHFSLITASSGLFHLTRNLANDLSIKPLYFEEICDPQAIWALGAATWKNDTWNLNILPKSKAETLRAVKEFFRGAGSKVPSNKAMEVAQKVFTANIGTVVILPVFGVVGVLGYPIYDRWDVNRRIESGKRVLAGLENERKRINSAKEREGKIEEKNGMVKSIEKRRMAITDSLKELFTTLPAGIRLTYLVFRDDNIVIRGVANDNTDVQKFLSDAAKMRRLIDPQPSWVRKGAGTSAEFEMVFRFAAAGGA